MKPIKLTIKTKTQKYPILIGNKLVNKVSKILSDNSIKFEKCLLVIDKNVPNKLILQIKKSLKHKKIFIYTFNANEKSKNQKTIDIIIKIDILLGKSLSVDFLLTIDRIENKINKSIIAIII